MTTTKTSTITKPFVIAGIPKKLQDLALEPTLLDRIRRCITNYQQMPHLILSGAPGTGKTSTARVIASEILKNKTSFNYLQINASSERGVDSIRNTVYNFASNKSFINIDAPMAPYKIILLDEADSMTADAQNALRNLMQTYMENCRFIFSCNDYNKIIPALRSRTLRLVFEPVSKELLKKRVLEVIALSNQELDLKDEELDLICEEAKGDFRYVYNKLGQEHPTDLKQNLTNLIEYIVVNSLKENFLQAYKTLQLEQVFIQTHFKALFVHLCKRLLEVNSIHSFTILDRLARAQAAVISGATEFVQFMGWYSYYRKMLSENNNQF